jgi:hypothetical protein
VDDNENDYHEGEGEEHEGMERMKERYGQLVGLLASIS